MTIKIKAYWFVLILLVVAVVFAVAGILVGNAIHWTKSPKTNSTSSTNSTPIWVNTFDNDTKRIIQFLTKGDGKGVGWNWTANITDKFGPRLFGGKNLENAIDYIVSDLKGWGFDNVHTELVPNCSHWVRGTERATLIQPRSHSIAILGLGGSIFTPPGGITAKAVVVRSFAELDVVGKQGKVNQTILVYNEPWAGTYGNTVAYRYGGSAAAKYGAAAVLVKSITPFSVYSPHTGTTGYSSIRKIPVAALTIEDAEMLWRMQERGQELRIHLLMTSDWANATVDSRNTVFELKGKEKPNEVVMLSGHIDSWDVAEGAMDDAGGCAAVLMALAALKALGEEVGWHGAAQYYADHQKWTNETFVFVSESDEGVFRPTSQNATMWTSGSKDAVFKLNQMSQLIRSNGIPNGIVKITDLGEINYWARNGVPGFYYMNMDKYYDYFIFHHSSGDTMTVLKPDDIDYTAALYASYANIIANMDTNLPKGEMTYVL